MFYSVIYTSVPTIVVGIWDKDLSDKTLLQYPKLYGAGHRHEAYNLHLFWITMIDTLWQSLVLFYMPLFIYSESSIDIWSMGSLWTIAVVVLVNIHLAMDIQRWVSITHIAVWGSIVITYACMVVLDSIPVFPNYWSVSYIRDLICFLYFYLLADFLNAYFQDHLSSGKITFILAHHFANNRNRDTSSFSFQSGAANFLAF